MRIHGRWDRMIGLLMGILGFLFYVVGFLTLRYGFQHHNKYVKIYSICATVWTIFIGIGNLEIFGIVLYRLTFYELNLLLIILPLIPLWIIYRKRDKTEENRKWREMGGKVKGDAELFRIFQDTGCKKCPKCGSENLKDIDWYRVDCLDCGWLYIGEDIGRMSKPKPTPKPTLKPTTQKPTPLPEHRPKCLHPKNDREMWLEYLTEVMTDEEILKEYDEGKLTDKELIDTIENNRICAHCGTDKDVSWINGEFVCSECWDVLSEFAGE